MKACANIEKKYNCRYVVRTRLANFLAKKKLTAVAFARKLGFAAESAANWLFTTCMPDAWLLLVFMRKFKLTLSQVVWLLEIVPEGKSK